MGKKTYPITDEMRDLFQLHRANLYLAEMGLGGPNWNKDFHLALAVDAVRAETEAWKKFYETYPEARSLDKTYTASLAEGLVIEKDDPPKILKRSESKPEK